MTLAERANAIKYEFFEEFYQLIKDYDFDRVKWDETYEISKEADEKWNELVDFSEEWDIEFWGWAAQKKNGGEK